MPTTYDEPPGVPGTSPTGSVTIAGTPTQGQTLTAANTLADADGLGTITYQWQSSTNGTTWSTLSTGSTLELTTGLIGQLIRVQASYTDGHGTAESVTSSPTSAPVAMSVADADVLRVTQALYGSAPSYSTFQADSARITANGETSYLTSVASQSQFTTMTDAQFSHLLIVNTGLSAFTELETALTYYITANEVGAANTATVRGIITLQLTTLLSGLETVTGPQAIFNAAAVAFNIQQHNALIYATDPAHTTSQPLTSAFAPGALSYNHAVNQLEGIGNDTLMGSAILYGDSGTHTQAEVLVSVAEPPLHQDDIGLVGLAQTGAAFS